MSDAADARPIAIIGIGCRFPGGVVDAESFWQLLANGVDAITEFPADRFDIAAYHDERPATPGKVMSKWGGFIQQRFDEFDAEFFGISRHYAERLDPQQRLLLETAWEALEDAGQDVPGLQGSATGVFIGQWLSDFEHRLFADHAGIDFAATLGSGRYAVPGRLSYAMGFRGPSLSLDAGCSAGLAAVHLAVRSLRCGESTMALAGGVNVILQPHIHVAYSQSRMMAPDGRCKFGDARGDGYVRAEGVGVVVLKPLDRALADGDRVYAVIRGSAVNSDGDSSGSMGTPSRVGQEELLRTALSDANVAPADVTYVEAHGTGTRAGDPVELGVLAAVLSEGRAPGNPAWVGSVKTNFGHTEATAGVAGLIKGALMVQRGLIPPSLNFREPNPGIAWSEVPVAIPTSLLPWPEGRASRVVGVSSFGIGGTNAHVVLESAPPTAVETETSDGPFLLPLSTRSPKALRALAAAYAEMLETTQVSTYAVCRNAATRRSALSYRAAFVAADRLTLTQMLRAYAAGAPATAEGSVYDDASPGIAFVAPGQGGQWHGMARRMMQSSPTFRKALLECDAACRAVVPWSLVDQLHLDVDDPAFIGDRIDVIQPMLVALAIAYAAWLRSVGVSPDAVVGHSLGEVGAAAIAGAIDVASAMRIVCQRSALMRRTSGRGAMAAIELSAEAVGARLVGREHQISVAVSNSPRSTVISGDIDAVHALIGTLDAEGVFTRLVKVDVASHGPHMEPLVPELVSSLAGLSCRRADVPLYSTVTAAQAAGDDLDAPYWGRNLRQPVRFKETIELMVEAGLSAFVELGPHPVLSLAITQSADGVDRQVAAVACGQRDTEDMASATAVLAALWTKGASLNWAAVMPIPVAIVDLPRYPWQRERYWCSAANGGRGERQSAIHTGGHPFLGARTETAAEAGGLEWAVVFSGERSPWMADHVVRGSALVPAAAIIETMLAAVRDVYGSASGVELRRVMLDEPLAVNDDARTLRLVAVRSGADALDLALRVQESSGWRTVAHGRGQRVMDDESRMLSEVSDAVAARPSSVVSEGADQFDGDAFYRSMARRQLRYGPRFQVVDTLECGEEEAYAALTARTEDPVERRVTLLDGALQALLSLTPASVAGTDETLVPTAFDRIISRVTSGSDRSGAIARVESTDDHGTMHGSVTLRGEGEVPDLVASGVAMTAVRSDRPDALGAMRYRIAWVPVTLGPGRADSTGSTLIVLDAQGLGARAARRLRASGVDVIEWAALDAMSDRPLPHNVGDVIVCTPLDAGADVAPDAVSFDRALESVYDVPLAVIQRVVSAEVPIAVRLLTGGAVCVSSSSEVTSPLQAATWGLARVVRQEYPQLRCVVIDGDASSLETLVATRSAIDGDVELACRDAQWWAGRFERVTGIVSTSPSPGDVSYGFAASGTGVVDEVGWSVSTRRAPAAHEVEIAVRASGLNFLDVLVVLNAYPASAATTPSYAPRPGLECSGVVTRIGRDVTGIAVGDRVMAIGEGALGSHVLVHAALVVGIPDGVTMEEAAGFPLAFLTAAHALEDVARLRVGERVLVHSAAGGVGLAALQIARRVGAEVFATAGTPEKRAMLRSMGISQVFDSRGLAWSDDVLAATDGRGVDVVLNSLAGPAIEAGFRALANRGRFVEIGKRDVFGGTRMGMEVFQRQATVACVCLLAQMRDEPESLGARFHDLVRRLADGELTLLPSTPWPSDQIADALRSLLPGTHVGKAVVSHEVAPSTLRASPPSARVRDDATYMITGGLGALGLRSAQWLVDRGARHLLLVGRSAPDDSARSAIDALEGAGAAVQAMAADIAHEETGPRIQALLQRMPPLAGVLHAAGVLDDGLLTDQTPRRMRVVAEAKVRGFLRLAMLPELRSVDFVVLFSSIAGALGTRGQGNYAAANAVLDAMAHALRAQGVPATSIGFGPFAGRGLATRGRRLQVLADRGIGAMRLTVVGNALDALAGSSVAHEVVAALDPVTWMTTHAAAVERLRFAAFDVIDLTSSSVADPRATTTLRERVSAVPGVRQRADLLLEFVRAEVAGVLRTSVDRVEPLKALRTMGIDSLTALELRNRLEQATTLRLPGTLVFTYPTAAAIATHLLECLAPVDAAPGPETVVGAAPADGASVAEETGDDEFDALVREMATMDEAELARLLDGPVGGTGA